MKSMRLFAVLLALPLLFFSVKGEASELKVGFVNLKQCIEKSKRGQQEKNNFETLKNQMSETLEKTDKELGDIAKKLEDQDYLDTLSPTAEDELKEQFQRLSQEFVHYQKQYYQLLNQANYRMLQALNDVVSSASEAVREKHNFSLILNQDSTFAFAPTMDMTDEVVKEMDKRFEQENEQAPVAAEKAPTKISTPEKAVEKSVVEKTAPQKAVEKTAKKQR